STLRSEGRFTRPCAELVDGLLGPEGSRRLADIESSDGFEASVSSPLPALRALAAQLRKVSESVVTWAPALIGFEVEGRYSDLLLEAGATSE
ncbi:unnamed protein product, partial [Polarella glacialis]